jgi:hypothetical protein
LEPILHSMSKAELHPHKATAPAGGVYVLYYPGRPVYVGQSWIVYDRVYSHLTQGTMVFNSWRVLPIADDALCRRSSENVLF